MVLCCLLVRHGKQFSFLLIYCIFMMECKHWVDKKCSGTLGKLLEDEDLGCDRYCARSDKGLPYYSLILEEHTLEVLDAFCHLGVMITTRVHHKHGTIARTISAAESSVNYCHS